MSGYAWYLKELKRYRESEALYREAPEIRTRIFGWDDEATLRSRRDLAGGGREAQSAAATRVTAQPTRALHIHSHHPA